MFFSGVVILIVSGGYYFLTANYLGKESIFWALLLFLSLFALIFQSPQKRVFNVVKEVNLSHIVISGVPAISVFLTADSILVNLFRVIVAFLFFLSFFLIIKKIPPFKQYFRKE